MGDKFRSLKVHDPAIQMQLEIWLPMSYVELSDYIQNGIAFDFS